LIVPITKSFIPLVALATLIASSTGAAPTPRPGGSGLTSQKSAFPFAFAEKVLGNGLRIFVVPYDSPGLVAYYSVVRTGSRNEVEPGKSGFAHFFEHMMFRGTERYSTERYNAEIKAMGADSNAFTAEDMTVFHILAGKSALAKVVEIEADRFQNLKYDDASFQKEARAVLGEYNKGSSDPMQKMEEALYDHAFVAHSYKHTTIGFLRDIENMPHQFDYSRQFFDRYYRPDNVILLVVGDVTADAVVPLVEKAYGAWARGPARPPVPVEPPQMLEERITVPWKGASLPMLFVGYRTPAFSTKSLDGPALEVLGELLFAERSRLHKQLVLDEQKVETLEGSAGRHVDPNLFLVLARVKQSQDMATVESTIDKEIARIAAQGVDEKTLGEVLSHARYAFAAQLSTPDHVALVGAEFLALDGRLSAIDEYFARLAQVTSADVQRVARTYFTPRNRTVVTLQPEAP
jgi:zinc protease